MDERFDHWLCPRCGVHSLTPADAKVEPWHCDCAERPLVARFDVPEGFGPRVRWQRQRRRMSLRELSRRVRVSPSHLSDVERGINEPSLGIAARIAAELRISLNWLAGLDA